MFNRTALVVWSLLFCLACAEIGLRILGRIQGIDYRLYAENLLSPTQFSLGLSCHWKGYTYPSLCPNFAGVFSSPDYSVGYKTHHHDPPILKHYVSRTALHGSRGNATC